MPLVLLHARRQCDTRARCGWARRKNFSLRREFSALVRMMPVEVMVPTTGGLTLALPASGPRPPYPTLLHLTLPCRERSVCSYI